MQSAPTSVIADNGTVYVGSWDSKLYALQGSFGPMVSGWPMYSQNPQRTGRAMASPVTFELVQGIGDSGNSSFTIEGNELKSAASFDYQNQVSYTVRVKATPASGNPIERILTIKISETTGATQPLNIPSPPVVGSDYTVNPLVDYDGDGLANLLEHALGSDPASNASTYSPALQVVQDGSGGTFIAFHFTVNNSATDVTTIIEQSTDLHEWEPVDMNIASIQSLDHGDFTEKIVYLPTTSEALFLRLSVNR